MVSTVGWVDPFGDDLHTGLAHFPDRSLPSVADQIGRLPAVARSGPRP